MNRRSNIHFGPGAASLILIFVVLSMSVLGMLALINGRNDARLSRRSAQVIEAVYQLNERAELRRAELDALVKNHADYAALLPEGVSLEDGALCWTEEDGLRTLDCALSAGDGGTAWLRHDMMAETEDDW
ncbi:MAG: hypothetical protein IJ664_05075 [Clostridia bacterium]|nr:hypothetical protein [Clostridia bacterium]